MVTSSLTQDLLHVSMIGQVASYIYPLNFCFSCAADKPTFNQLLILKKADGSAADSLHVIQWISSSDQYLCEDFASLLLNDPVKVKIHQREYKDNADKFIQAVLKDWLSRDDSDPSDPAVPRTWEALAQCVTDAELDGTLAKAIRDACPPVHAGVVTRIVT